MTSDELFAHLMALEQLLHNRATRNAPTAAILLTEDFREFGASGRTYDKAAILALLAQEFPPIPPLTTTNYQIVELAPTTALLTYIAIGAGVTTLRSSLWVRRGDGWQILFHQGTRAPEPTPSARVRK